MKKKTFIIGPLALLILVSAFFIFRPHSPNMLAKFDFAAVKRMDLSEKIDATGLVLALAKKEIYPDFEGTVDQVNVKAGEKVRQGDILMTLSSTSLNSQWQDANTALKQAKINLSQATSQLATEVALNSVSKTNALQVETLTHQVGSSRAQVKQAEQNLATLKAQNDGVYTAKNEELSIRAPFAGKVSWVDVTQGDKISPQTRLATIIKPDSLGVDAQIDENDISLIRPGQPAEVTGKDQKQTINTGRVSEISSQGQSTAATGQSMTDTAQAIANGVINFPVRILLGNSPQGLQPGMSVDVTVLASSHPNVLAIPAGAVTRMEGNDIVRVLRGNRVVPVAVHLGLKQGKFYEVKFGLKPGDQVGIPKPPSIAKLASTPGGGQRMGMSPMGR